MWLSSGRFARIPAGPRFSKPSLSGVRALDGYQLAAERNRKRPATAPAPAGARVDCGVVRVASRLRGARADRRQGVPRHGGVCALPVLRLREAHDHRSPGRLRRLARLLRGLRAPPADVPVGDHPRVRRFCWRRTRGSSCTGRLSTRLSFWSPCTSRSPPSRSWRWSSSRRRPSGRHGYPGQSPTVTNSRRLGSTSARSSSSSDLEKLGHRRTDRGDARTLRRMRRRRRPARCPAGRFWRIRRPAAGS